MAKGGGDVYSNAANALSGAGNIYSNPQLTGGPATASAYGYGAAPMAAAKTANPDLIAGGINRYMNPYTDTVINRTAADIQRGANVQTQQNNASAVAAGAFGGGRQGVVDAITNSEAQKNIGDMSGQLRAQGFDTAAGLSAQDVANKMGTGQFNANLLQQARSQNAQAANTAAQYTAGAKNNASQYNAGTKNEWEMAQANEAMARAAGLGNLGSTAFNIGQTIGGQQQQQGAVQQQLIQAIMDKAGGQFSGWQGQPTNMLNTLLASLGMNPLNDATTTTQTSKPGMFDWLSLAGQTAFGS